MSTAIKYRGWNITITRYAIIWKKVKFIQCASADKYPKQNMAFSSKVIIQIFPYIAHNIVYCWMPKLFIFRSKPTRGMPQVFPAAENPKNADTIQFSKLVPHNRYGLCGFSWDFSAGARKKNLCVSIPLGNRVNTFSSAGIPLSVCS